MPQQSLSQPGPQEPPLQPVYLIDASIYIFRAYFSIPDEWFSPEGYSVNALYGYTHFLLKFLQKVKPSQLAVAYDESLGSCFRNEIYPGYKSSRELPDEELAYQLAACKRLTEVMGIASPASERYEADDIIATFACMARQKGHDIAILTRDKDLGQLIQNDGDYLWDFAENKRTDKAAFFERFAVRTDQVTDYLALVGDSVDDIPGVPGIGKKTAARLLQQFGDIKTLYQDLDAVATSALRGAKGLAEKLRNYREQVSMAQALVRLETQVPLGDVEQLNWQPPCQAAVQDFFDEYGLGQRFQRQLDNSDWWK